MKKDINKINYKLSTKTKRFFIKLWILYALLWVLSCNDINSLQNSQKKDDKNNKALDIGKDNIAEWHKQVEKAKEEMKKW